MFSSRQKRGLGKLRDVLQSTVHSVVFMKASLASASSGTFCRDHLIRTQCVVRHRQRFQTRPNVITGTWFMQHPPSSLFHKRRSTPTVLAVAKTVPLKLAAVMTRPLIWQAQQRRMDSTANCTTEGFS